MRINKYLAVISITYITLGFFGVLNADISLRDELINASINKYTPVYNGSDPSVTTITGDEPFYDTDAVSNTSVLGHVKTKLVRAKVLDYIPARSLAKTFLGYSDKDSYIQLYIKPATVYYLLSEGELFGDPIPLVPGEYTTDAHDSNLGNFSVTLKITESILNIKVVRSGLTTWTTIYEDAPIYLIEILKVEKN